MKFIARFDADSLIARREFVKKIAASSTAAMLWPSIAEPATTEIWEEGDLVCKVPYPTLDEPKDYKLDLEFLNSFIGLSERLTGVAPLDRHLANQYMERYATHPQITKNLNLIITEYRNLPNKTEDDAKQTIFMSLDPKLRAGAKQLMYLWYISAFFLPLDTSPELDKPPFEDSDTRKRVWVYGTPEQYRAGLVWKIIQAHAPMTPGGARNYWANIPSSA